MGPVVPAPEAIRQTVQEVLAQPEFGAASPPWYIELLKLIQGWGNHLGQWASDHPVAGWLVIGFLILLLVGLLLLLAYAALGDLLPGGRARRGARRTTASWTILEGTAESWPRALKMARQALAAGEVRRAVWIGHRVLLGLLDEQGTIRFAGGKTNADYLRECAADHPWRPSLAALTEIYDRVVYGHRESAPFLVAGLLDQVEACHRQSQHD